ncbi:MAG: OB-fold domain-containing protein [Dehalococcoidia bacterium]|nr:OB-fold domain-containing protein [Dehalococcoidia bacterium]
MPYLEKIPLPKPSIEDAPFWEACHRHELVIQRCTNCRTFRHTPTPVCYNCQSFDFEWVKVSGKGTVFTYTNVAHPVHPALKERVPFNLVIVELPDAGNVRLAGNVIDTPFEELYIGMPVEVIFEDYPEGATLPRFKRADR